MRNLDENDLKVLFESLGQILHNQDKINKHFGINKHDCDWGYEDTKTEDLSQECFVITQDYKDYIWGIVDSGKLGRSIFYTDPEMTIF